MPEIFDLTPEQSEAFARRGVVRLPGFYAKTDIDPMADRLWRDLEARYGMRPDQPASWTVTCPAQFQALKRSGAFDALGSRKLSDLADAVLGAGRWERPAHWGGPLVTFPTAVPTQPRPAWHLDITGSERLTPLPTLRVFTFLEPAPPRGGGTLYVAGSHRFAIDLERLHGGPLRSAQVRDHLEREHAWFARLLATKTAGLRELINVEARVGAHLVRLEEMTGAPGDLIIMHPALLHGAAHNELDRPRMMLTEWVSRRHGAAD